MGLFVTGAHVLYLISGWLGGDTSAGVMAGELVGVTFEGKEGVFSSLSCLILELLMALRSVRLIY